MNRCMFNESRVRFEEQRYNEEEEFLMGGNVDGDL